MKNNKIMMLCLFVVVCFMLQPSAAARLCPVGSWLTLRPGTSWQWQLTKDIDTSFDVGMYDVDLFDASQAVIDNLHQKGRVVICYFNAGAWEDWRRDAKNFPSSVLGNPLDGWPGEKWFDTRSSIVRQLMQVRLDLAVSKQCDGVEPDNMDGYQNKPGFPLTAQTQLDYNRFIAREAHRRYLSVGLKNDLDQVKDLVNDFDWALNEQCNQYGECGMLSPFVAKNKAVFGVEYTGQTTKFCPTVNALNFDWLKKNLGLDAPRTACRTYSRPKGTPFQCYKPTTNIVPSIQNTSFDLGAEPFQSHSTLLTLQPVWFVMALLLAIFL